MVQVRKPPVTYSFKVVQTIEKRVGAKLVADVMENVTPPEQYELLELSKVSGFINRAKGMIDLLKKSAELWRSSQHWNLLTILTLIQL